MLARRDLLRGARDLGGSTKAADGAVGTAKLEGVSVRGRRDRTRTCDPRLRRPMLYPTELRARTGFTSIADSEQQVQSELKRTSIIERVSDRTEIVVVQA